MVWGALAASFFDATHPRAGDAELAWYAQRIPASTTLALDVMCGAGRVLVPLVAQGAKVHGVDASPSMVARCEAKLAAQSLAATLFRQDVVALNLPFRYGAAFVAGSAFDEIADPAAAAAALERIRAHLVAPALLVIDCDVPSTTLQRLAAPLVEVRTARLADGSQIVLRSETVWTAEVALDRDRSIATCIGAAPSASPRRASRCARRGTRRPTSSSSREARAFATWTTEAVPFARDPDGESFALVARA